MPTDLPERKSKEQEEDERSRVSGKLVVIIILVWTAAMLAFWVYADRTGLGQAIYDTRHAAGGP